MVKPLPVNPSCKIKPQSGWTNILQREETMKKRKLIQQQLILLLHANQCRKQDDSPQRFKECPLLHCKEMKNILRHMVVCGAGRTCQFAYCSSSKMIISHYKRCTDSACSVCKPLKLTSRDSSAFDEMLSSTNQPQNVTSELTPQPSTSRQNVETPSVAVHSSTNSIISENLFLEIIRQQELQQSQNLQPDIGNTQQQTFNEPGFGTSEPTSNSSNNNSFQSLINAITAMPIIAQKEWHKTIPVQHREMWIRKMACIIFPSSWIAFLRVQTIPKFLELLQFDERNTYETSNSFIEYRRRLAERCCEARKKLIEIHQAHKERRRQQQQQLQQSQALEPDVEMSEPRQENNSVVEPLDMNSNVPDNQLLNPVPDTSNIAPSASNTSTNVQQNVPKEWHNDISEFRELLINEFVRKLLAVCGHEVTINNLEEPQSSTIDARLKSYVKNAENDIYQKANSRMEYYDLLAASILKFKANFGKEISLH